MARSRLRDAERASSYTVDVAFRAVIFDFDGLIIDSESPLFDMWREIYTQNGAELTLESWSRALGTHNGFDPYEHLAACTGVRLSREEWAPRLREEHWRRCELLPLLPGVRDRLAEARTLGMSTAVASSSGSAWVRPWLERHDLISSIDAVCTRDDVATVKPAPDLFLLAARRLGVQPADCLVFEDTPNGLTAAHLAGMWAIAVPGPLTRTLEMPSPHVVLTSLAASTLAALQRELVVHRMRGKVL